ncbi:hypothetical protein OHA98_21990 [Streptomyces sp. NBC_00654]|uniref:hypothetical protein n=1 Tax=Streptomyces sp. NBC_00654 TaxID=2975799 RepID=UPI0022597E0E|nr:hypothetical protein [Streptomyces sp. NBC_00654]MCX4967385.1 hypothetical protein [Streptomyces sp. NBC_00654]
MKNSASVTMPVETNHCAKCPGEGALGRRWTSARMTSASARGLVSPSRKSVWWPTVDSDGAGVPRGLQGDLLEVVQGEGDVVGPGQDGGDEALVEGARSRGNPAGRRSISASRWRDSFRTPRESVQPLQKRVIIRSSAVGGIGHDPGLQYV